VRMACVGVAGLLAAGCASPARSHLSEQSSSTSVLAAATSASSATSGGTTTTVSPGSTVRPRQVGGPFAVGGFTQTIVDSERHRVLVTVIRYPAVGAAGTMRPGAQPLRAAGPFPVFVWSHGFDATPGYFESFLDAWAAAGYVVVAPTFPGTSSYASPPVFRSYVDQPADVTVILNAIMRDNSTAGNLLDGLIDPTRIAAGGHSLGAVTTEALTQQSRWVDRRITAAVEISYGNEPFPSSTALHRAIPTLFIAGDADTTFPVSDSETAFADGSGTRFLIILHGASHTPFRTWAAPIITSAVIDFLDLALKGDPSGPERLQALRADPRVTVRTAT
jgi:predicted dienelactone hydrolase